MILETWNELQNYFKCKVCSGGARGIAARGQIYMGAPIGVVEIHLRLEIAAAIKVPSAPSPPPPPPVCSATDAKTRTPNAAVFDELGRIPISVLCKERILLYWLQIVSNKNSIMYKI